MAYIKRVVFKNGINKVDFTGNVPSPADNNEVKLIDVDKGVPTPITNVLDCKNTTIRYTNRVNKQSFPKTTLIAGQYDDTFIAGDVSYDAEQLGNLFKVSGGIEWKDANPGIGLAAGNHVILRIANPTITLRAELPEGIICKVTNTDAEGGYNTADKFAFEADGTLIVGFELSSSSSLALDERREIKIAWSTKDGALEWTTYVVDCKEAVLLPA